MVQRGLRARCVHPRGPGLVLYIQFSILLLNPSLEARAESSLGRKRRRQDALLGNCLFASAPQLLLLKVIVKQDIMLVLTPCGNHARWPPKVLLVGYGLGNKAQHQKQKAPASTSNVT